MIASRISTLKEILDKNLYDVDIINGKISNKNSGKSIGSIPCRPPSDYVRISFRHNKKVYYFFLHQIIAFSAGLDVLNKDVNHIDGNKINNKISNLETVTRSENTLHAMKTGLLNLKGENHPWSKLKEKNISKIRKDYKNGVSQGNLAKKYGVSQATIFDVIHKKTWKDVK